MCRSFIFLCLCVLRLFSSASRHFRFSLVAPYRAVSLSISHALPLSPCPFIPSLSLSSRHPLCLSLSLSHSVSLAILSLCLHVTLFYSLHLSLHLSSHSPSHSPSLSPPHSFSFFFFFFKVSFFVNSNTCARPLEESTMALPQPSSPLYPSLCTRQTDVMHQSVFELVHTEDQLELRKNLHWALNPPAATVVAMNQNSPTGDRQLSPTH